MKKLNVKPTEILVLEFEDGVQKKLKFSSYAMMILDDEFEGVIKVMENVRKKPFSEGAKLIYAGMKAGGEKVEYKDAQAIITNIDIDTLLEVYIFAADTIGKNKEIKKQMKKKGVSKKKK